MPRLSDQQREARREQILTAALHCVARQGFHKTSMAEVISASGLSAGAVYGYFRGKAELIAALADRSIGMVSPALDEAIAADPPPSIPEVLRRAAAAIEELAAAADVDVTRVATAAWAEAARDETVRALVAERITGLREKYAEFLRRRRDLGELGADVDVDAAAQVMLATMPGFIIQRLVVGDVDSESLARGAHGLGLR